MTCGAMDRPDYLYRRLKLVPELINRGPVPERWTKLREYRFRLGFGDKVSDSSLLCGDAPHSRAAVTEPVRLTFPICGSRGGLQFDYFAFPK